MANMTSSVSASQVAGELASATFEEIPALVEHYREDPRQQVIKLRTCLKRHAKELSERERVNGMYELMHELGGDGVVVGVDEVGRGSVAGPLTVCAVCLPMEPRIWGINDSKKLTPARRELLSVKIARWRLLSAFAISLLRISMRWAWPAPFEPLSRVRWQIRGLSPIACLWTVTPWAPCPMSATWSRAMPRSPVSPRHPSWQRSRVTR